MQGSLHVIPMAPHVHFHQCTPPIPLGHHKKLGFPLFTVLAKLSHLVLLHGKSSKIDHVISLPPPPPPGVLFERFHTTSQNSPTWGGGRGAGKEAPFTPSPKSLLLGGGGAGLRMGLFAPPPLPGKTFFRRAQALTKIASRLLQEGWSFRKDLYRAAAATVHQLRKCSSTSLFDPKRMRAQPTSAEGPATCEPPDTATQ